MLPVLFKSGSIAVYSFGLLLGLGFLVSSFLIFRFTKKEYLDENIVFDVIFMSVISGILGARAFYIIEHFDTFGFNLLYWILINARPGFSLWGGLGIGFSVFLILVKKNKLPVFKLLDTSVFAFTVTFIFGKIGAFLAGTSIGTPTKLPWGIVFFSTLKRHPISLYEALLAVLVLILVLNLKKIFDKKRLPSGSLFFIYIPILVFTLFWVAFFREDVIFIWWFFKIDQIIYICLFLVSLVFFYRRLGRGFRRDISLIGNKIRKNFKFKKKEKYEKLPGKTA
ncbi:MAG: prolipoprotein diacylglyceryl transferase [Patescibacteria group bacterium]|nr:prolipoprotein diacylglyceryl transferase [Patescibacteria group bacterium]